MANKLCKDVVMTGNVLTLLEFLPLAIWLETTEVTHVLLLQILMVLFIVLEVDVVVTKYDVLAFVFGYKELETVGIVTATLLVDFTKAVTIELLPRVTEDDNVKLVAEVVAIVELLIIGIMVEIVDVLLLLKLLVADSEVLK